uniref:Uncharacterized protein n=1 Tax=Vespula pensylvanica TaxID=30213 RepID=A0A834UGF2_VESPE|nr:hypothetical protein H0235_000453 [Vespula pensylvanica]
MGHKGLIRVFREFVELVIVVLIVVVAAAAAAVVIVVVIVVVVVSGRDRDFPKREIPLALFVSTIKVRELAKRPNESTTRPRFNSPVLSCPVLFCPVEPSSAQPSPAQLNSTQLSSAQPSPALFPFTLYSSLHQLR